MTIIGGKGGVGKTTVAAATALALADTGLRTLVLSTDPAHSLGDAFERGLGNKPREIGTRLWGVEPDADAAVRSRVNQVTDDAQAALPKKIMPAVQRHLKTAATAPGMAESALNDLFIGYLERVPADWDHLVVDSAATGHLLRMLELPALLTPWVRGLARQRERTVNADRFAGGVLGAADEPDDPLLSRLHSRRRRLEAAADRLRHDALVHLVLVPRRMVLAETRRAAEELASGGFALGQAVLNQASHASETDVLAMARANMATHGLAELDLSDVEPTGEHALRVLGRSLHAQGFPCHSPNTGS